MVTRSYKRKEKIDKEQAIAEKEENTEITEKRSRGRPREVKPALQY